jgi:thiol:disulfide interchange protein
LAVAPLWLGGLISSHTDRTAVIWVAGGWVALSAAAVLLRQAIAKVQLGEELQSALLRAEERSRARLAR